MNDGPPHMMDAECYSCGKTLEILQPECADCTPDMPGLDELERTKVIEVPELEKLVKQWRDKQEESTLPSSGLTGEGHMVKQCADELEQLINE